MIRALLLSLALAGCAAKADDAESEAYDLAVSNDARIIALEAQIDDLEASNEYLEKQVNGMIRLNDVEAESFDRLFTNDETLRQNVNYLRSLHGQAPVARADD